MYPTTKEEFLSEEDRDGIRKHSKRYRLDETKEEILFALVGSFLTQANEDRTMDVTVIETLMHMVLRLAKASEDSMCRVTLEILTKRWNERPDSYERDTRISFFTALRERIHEIEKHEGEHLELTTLWLFEELCQHLGSNDVLRPACLSLIGTLWNDRWGNPTTRYQNIFWKATKQLKRSELKELRVYAEISNNVALRVLIDRLETRPPLDPGPRPSA